MTPLEKEMSTLAKDLAVIVSIQKNCQKNQDQTTVNVNKLVTSVDKLSHDTVYLQGLVKRLETVENSLTWFRRTMATFGLGTAGTIMWFFIKMPK